MSRRAPRSFTPDQQQAISADGHEVLVVAPAGSGKTEVLIQRVIRTLEHSPGKSFRLLVVTFTFKAAEELKRRARAAIAEELWRVDADTIHGFALDWLRRYGKEVGVTPDVVVLSDDIDRAAVVVEYLNSVGQSSDIDGDPGSEMRTALEAIDSHRLRHDGTNCRCDSDFSHYNIAVSELSEAYEARLRQRGAIDFPGMLLGFHRMLDEDRWVLEHFQTLYREILVDEGQDLTAVQSALLRRLAGSSLRLFVVADDKQSIRGYAGGAYTHALQLVPGVAQAPLRLRHNFRCSRKILSAAETVLQPGTDSAQRVMSPENIRPGRANFAAMASTEAEADHISSWAAQLMESGLPLDTIAEGEDASVTPEEIAVFGRTRWTLAPIATAFQRCGIEFVVQTDAAVFLPEPDARIFVDCLAYLLNGNDAPAARRVIDELRELMPDVSSDDPLQALDSSDSEALHALGDLARRCEKGGDEFEGAMADLRATGAAHGWNDGARTLDAAWQDYSARSAVQDRSPNGFLGHLAKIQRTRPTDPGVRLLTIDRAKGLEFKAVALIGARDGLIPHYRANSGQERNEDRRRLYVAMTRASRELLVSWPTTTVDSYGRTHRQTPSPFLVEAGLVRPTARPR